MKTFFPTRTFLSLIISTLVVVPMARADDEADLAKLTPEAQKTAHKILGSSKVEEVEPAYVEGQYATEIEFKRDGKNMAIVISKDGTLLQTEERMSPKDAPEAIKNAVAKQFPDQRISHIKSVEKKGALVFEVTVGTIWKSHHVKFDKNGKLLESDTKK